MPDAVDRPDASHLAGIERRMQELRDAGRYADAALLAELIRADAERSVGTLKSIAALSDADRQRLREAERPFGRSTMRERIEHARRCLAVRGELLGSGHPDTLVAAASVSDLLLSRGGPDDMDEAEMIGRQVADARASLLGHDHPDTLASQAHMADLIRHRSRFVEAEKRLEDAHVALRRVVDEFDPRILACQYELAKVLEKRGQDEKAKELMRVTLAAQRRALGDRHPATLRTMNALGVLLRDEADARGSASAGLLAEAELWQREALAGRLAVLDDDDADTCKSMTQLAALLGKRKQPAEAEQLLRRALAIYEGSMGLAHWDTLRVMVSLMDLLYQDPDRRVEAMKLCDRALPPCRQLLNDERWEDRHTAVLAVATSLAAMLENGQRYEDAERMWAKAADLADALRTRAIGDERDRAVIASKLRLTELAVSHTRVLAKLGRQEEALSASERGRSRALLDLLVRDERDLVRQVSQQGPAQAAKLHDCLKAEEDARQQLADVEIAWIQRASILSEQGRKHATDAVHEARHRLRDAESRKFALLHEVWPESEAAGAKDILESLAEGDLMLSYLWSRRSVQVMVLAGPSAPVRVFTLAEGRDAGVMGDRVLDLRKWLFDGSLANPPLPAAGDAVAGAKHKAWRDITESRLRAANELFAQLLPPGVWEQVRSARRVIVLPHGPLNALPLESLVVGVPSAGAANPLADARFVIDEAPPIIYAASGTAYIHLREMRRAQQARQAENTRSSVLVLADPALELQGQQTAVPPAAPPDEIAVRGQADMDGLFPTLRALPFARAEADAIQRAVLAAGGSAKLLLGEHATLKQLLASAGEARFLQLATHGITGTADHPYGAALALTRPPRPTAGDIGYLRLEDLVRENWRERLRDCELVVLSACDTQRGVEVGDCVMSLPWGFFYAGAPAVVASLWRVDDQSTAQLMGGFYANLMDASRPGKPAAFRAARLRLKSRPVYGHPYHWAAFVYLGSPD